MQEKSKQMQQLTSCLL